MLSSAGAWRPLAQVTAAGRGIPAAPCTVTVDGETMLFVPRPRRERRRAGGAHRGLAGWRARATSIRCRSLHGLFRGPVCGLLHRGHAGVGACTSRRNRSLVGSGRLSRRRRATCALPGYEPIIAAILRRRRGGGRACDRLDRTGPMIEFRKGFFADEQNYDLNEVGKPTRPPGSSPATLHRPLALLSTIPPCLRRAACTGWLPLRPHHQRAHSAGSTVPRRPEAGCPAVVRACFTGQGRLPAYLNTLSVCIEFSGIDGRAGSLFGTGRWSLQGVKPVAAVIAANGSAGARGRRRGAGRLGAAAPRARRRGGARGRRAGGLRRLSRQQVRLPRQVRPPEAALRRRRGGLPRGRPHRRGPLPDVADRQAPIETCGAIAAPGRTTATSATPRPRRCSSRWALRRRCCGCPRRGSTSSGGPWGGGFGGKVDSIHEPLAILGRCSPGAR